MFLHTVFFWLKPDLTPVETAEFEAGLKSLTTIPTVRFKYVGTPAATRRSVVDSSYSYKLVVGFADRAGHDAYQTLDTHLAFIARCSKYWTKVQVYDADELA